MASSASLAAAVLLQLLLVDPGSAIVGTSKTYSESNIKEAIDSMKTALKNIHNTHTLPGFQFKMMLGFGSYSVDDGWISRIQSMEFLREPTATTVNVKPGDLRIVMELKFNDLVVQYKDLMISLGAEVNGFWAAKKVDNKVVVSVVRGLEACSTKVDSITVEGLSGLELLPNSYCPLCATAVPKVADSFNDYYTNVIEKNVRIVLKKLIKEALEACK